MLNTNTLALALAGAVGWHPVNDNADGPLKLPTALLASKSELYVNDLNELLALDVLAQIAPTGEKLGTYITRLQADAMKRLAARLADAQGLDGKVLVPLTSLVNTPGRRGAVVNKQGRFVGIKLHLTKLDGVAFTLPTLTIQLDAVQLTPLNFYVYSDAQPEPVAVVEMPASENKPFFPFEVNLGGIDVSFAGRGNYAYIGYYEDDLTGHAIPRDYTCAPCYCANDPYLVWGDYAVPRAISVRPEYLDDDRNLFDTSESCIAYEGQNFGLNLRFLSYCDVATALKSVRNIATLGEAAQLAVGIRMLEAIGSSSKINQLTARKDVQADALALLYNYQARLYGGKEHGTDNYYPSLLKSLQLDLSGLDAQCKPSVISPVSLAGLVR